MDRMWAHHRITRAPTGSRARYHDSNHPPSNVSLMKRPLCKPLHRHTFTDVLQENADLWEDFFC